MTRIAFNINPCRVDRITSKAEAIHAPAIEGPDDEGARSQIPTDDRGTYDKWILRLIGAEKYARSAQ